MCMHCRSLWSRINNLLVIDQYIYLGCPIATQGHSAILEKKELSNRSRTCQVKPLPPLFGTAYPPLPRIPWQGRSGPSREADAVDHWCRMGDLRQWKHAPLRANDASRSLTRVTQRFAAAIPSYFANVVGVGYWPSRYSTVGLIELGRHDAAGRRRSHYRCIMWRRPCQHRRLRFPNQLPVRSMHTRRRWCVHTSHGSLY